MIVLIVYLKKTTTTKNHCLHLCPLFTQLQWGDTVLPRAGSTNIPSREHKNL